MDAIFDEGFGLMDSFSAMIKYYYRRRVTYETDLLRAVTGLLKRLETQKNGRFHEGLPLPLDQSLLFKTLPSSARNQDGVVRRRSEFPSWSWTGWTAAFCWYSTETDYGLYDAPPLS